MKITEMIRFAGKHTLVYAKNHVICTGTVEFLNDHEMRLSSCGRDRILPLSSVIYMIEAPGTIVCG